MKKVNFSAAIIACCMSAFFSLASAATSGDTTWLFPNDSVQVIQAIDATTAANDTVATVDTVFSGIPGRYFNYNYQFTQGWAGINILWNYGTALSDMFPNFSLSSYDSLVFFYRGPLSTHSLTVWLGFTDGCGNETLDSIGIVPFSVSWARASFPIAAAKLQSGFNQLNFIIHDVAGDTALTSVPGNLKIDNIYLIKANPPAPILVSPPNNATDQATSSLDLSWGTVPYAISYGVQVSVNSNFSSTLFFQTGLTTTAAMVPNLAYGMTYYWEANAVTDSGSGLSAWSTAFKFTTATANSSKSKCGCGAGSGAAMLPPLWFKMRAYRKRKKNQLKSNAAEQSA